ncbi:PilZ domain-containing protein [Candidatus Omnitrophota bacterium]
MQNGSAPNGENRRKFKRISKNFILTYFNIDQPEKHHEITQLKNICEGGMCFIASQPAQENAMLGINLKTPYISETTFFEGKVLGSNEKISALVYEIRIEFDQLNDDAKFLINKLMDVFLKDQEN